MSWIGGDWFESGRVRRYECGEDWTDMASGGTLAFMYRRRTLPSEFMPCMSRGARQCRSGWQVMQRLLFIEIPMDWFVG